MKIIYIAHPIGGNVESNLSKLKIIGRKINLEEKNVVPFIPYFFDCCVLNDSINEERAKGIKNNTALFNKGFIDELRLYGNTISSGMIEEIKLASSLGIKVVAMTPETKEKLKTI